MDNKLIELSKPVAWVKADRNIAENWSCTDPEAVISIEGWHSDYNPTYSQEYASALLADRDAFEGAALALRDELREVRAELEASSLQCRGIEQERELFRLERTAHQLHAEALEQRIAELERANQSQDDHINQQQDRIDSLEKTNASLGRGLAAAEKRLATPVRLPEGLAQKIKVTGYYEALNEMMDCVRAAGFTVEGDE